MIKKEYEKDHEEKIEEMAFLVNNFLNDSMPSDWDTLEIYYRAAMRIREIEESLYSNAKKYYEYIYPKKI